jgi:hypothetical protein
MMMMRPLQQRASTPCQRNPAPHFLCARTQMHPQISSMVRALLPENQ